MIGAWGFSFRSPVRMPTCSGPKTFANSNSLALDRAFKGEAYQLRPPWFKTRSMARSAIQVLPEPVGAETRTSLLAISLTASF